MLHEIFYLLAILLWETVTCGVGYVAHRGTSLDNGLYNTCKILIVGSAGIFSIELNVLNELLSILHGSNSTLNDFLTIGIELIFDVRVACAYTRVYSLALSILQRLNGNINVLLNGSCECTDGWPRYSLGNLNNRIEIARA